MEAPLDIGSGDGGVDIHDQHGAAVAWKDVQVIGIELAVLGCEGRIKMMRHAAVPELKRFADQGDNELGPESLRAKGSQQGPRVSLLRKGL
jgi:hypothetical protein